MGIRESRIEWRLERGGAVSRQQDEVVFIRKIFGDNRSPRGSCIPGEITTTSCVQMSAMLFCFERSLASVELGKRLLWARTSV